MRTLQRHTENAAVGLHEAECGAAGALVLGVALAKEGGLSFKYTGALGESVGMLHQLCIGQGSLAPAVVGLLDHGRAVLCGAHLAHRAWSAERIAIPECGERFRRI